MTTDIDRLHKVVGGEIEGHRCGTTFAACHTLAGAIECNEPYIICNIPTVRFLQYLKPMVTEVLLEHGLSVQWNTKWTMTSHNSVVEFIVKPMLRDLAGRCGAIVDFTKECEEN